MGLECFLGDKRKDRTLEHTGDTFLCGTTTGCSKALRASCSHFFRSDKKSGGP